MRRATRKPCVEPDCPNLTGGATRCASCQRKNRRERKRRGLTGQRGSTTRWRRIRYRVLVRDGFACQRCGKTQDQAELHVHHLDGDARNDADENLATLCRPCHQDQHGA